MPHLVCSATDLNRLYPNGGTPDDEGLDDLGDDRHDAVLQHSLKLAKETNEQSRVQGRRRRPRDAAESQEEDAQGMEEPQEELEVAAKDETVGNVSEAANSAFGLRRSARLPTVPPYHPKGYLSKSDLLSILSKLPSRLPLRPDHSSSHSCIWQTPLALKSAACD